MSSIISQPVGDSFDFDFNHLYSQNWGGSKHNMVHPPAGTVGWNVTLLASVSLSGIVAPVHGMVFAIFIGPNTGGYTLNILHASSLSSLGNRFLQPQNFRIGEYENVYIRYDSALALSGAGAWHVLDIRY